MSSHGKVVVSTPASCNSRSFESSCSLRQRFSQFPVVFPFADDIRPRHTVFGWPDMGSRSQLVLGLGVLYFAWPRMGLPVRSCSLPFTFSPFFVSFVSLSTEDFGKAVSERGTGRPAHSTADERFSSPRPRDDAGDLAHLQSPNEPD